MSNALHEALAAANQLFDALYRGDWHRAAAQVPLPACITFREQQLASLTSWAKTRDAVRDAQAAGAGLVGWSSDGIYRPEMLAELGATPLRGLPNVPTLAALADLSPRDFLALYLEISNPRRGDAAGGPMERPRRRIVGGVLDGEDIVHVLYRAEGPAARHDDPHHVDVARFVLVEGAWSLDVAAQWRDIIDGAWFMMVIDDSFFRSGDGPADLPDV